MRDILDLPDDEMTDVRITGSDAVWVTYSSGKIEIFTGSNAAPFIELLNLSQQSMFW